MNILVTGAKGFLGKNFVAYLKTIKSSIDSSDYNIFEYDTDCEISAIDEFTKECDFVFHFAGVNRAKNDEDYTRGNAGFTKLLITCLKKNNNKSPIVMSSTIQAVMDNPYGKSKKAGEDLLLEFSRENSNPVCIYRLPNIFGKWGRPNYNSVVATFCHNISRGLDIKINDPNAKVTFVYIDDIIKQFVNMLESREYHEFCEILNTYNTTVGELAKLIYSFKDSRENKLIPDLKDEFINKLYSVHLSYLSEDDFSYPLKMNIDDRGSFTEFIKTPDRGQVSVNISKPGIIKGEHWHMTKNEKFLVVSGSGVIRFRKIGNKEIIEYHVSGEKLEAVDIPAGYTHNIENTGSCDMVTVMWASEQFDPENPDTIYEKV